MITQVQLLNTWESVETLEYNFFGREVASQVWGTGERDLPYDSLFVYLFRRFGPPMTPSDDYKDLCVYLLTTPDESVYVMIRLASYGFTAITTMGNKELAYHARMESFGNGARPIETRCNAALKALLTDLLKPVGIRDTEFNCLGTYTGEENNVPAFEWAGYPVIPVRKERMQLHLDNED